MLADMIEIGVDVLQLDPPRLTGCRHRCNCVDGRICSWNTVDIQCSTSDAATDPGIHAEVKEMTQAFDRYSGGIMARHYPSPGTSRCHPALQAASYSVLPGERLVALVGARLARRNDTVDQARLRASPPGWGRRSRSRGGGLRAGRGRTRPHPLRAGRAGPPLRGSAGPRRAPGRSESDLAFPDSESAVGPHRIGGESFSQSAELATQLGLGQGISESLDQPARLG